ncbi:MAG: FtsX-like permease family protein [Bacteroidales bacterium]|nr:FtsX-like permease family protein [Bacteroidales bacterium]
MKSYLKFLSHNKLYTVIEFVGLSVALAFVIISFCYVVQQYAVTRENPDRERIYAVGESESFLNCYGMKEVIDGKLPEVETVSHFQFVQDQLIHFGEQNFVGNMLVCDVDFFSIFPVVFKDGSPEMLSERNAAFISEKLAKKLNEASAERPLIIQDDTLHIVGVIADKGSSLLPDIDVMFNYEHGQSYAIQSYRENPFNHWANIGTFIKVRPDVDQEELASKLQALCDVQFENSPSWDGLMMVRFDELFYASVYTGLNKGDRSMLRTMIIIGLLLLISALLNYINLNVALVGKRAKEMASRRLLGAQKSDIVWKFLGEAFVFTLFSFVVGLAIAHAIVPTVNRLLQSDVAITISFALPYLAAYLLMVIVVSLLAGILPAAIISKAQPIDVVRGTFRFRNRTVLSKVFIVVQNVIAILLIALVLTMELQMHHMDERSTGLNVENLFFLGSDLDYTAEKEALVEELRALPCVKDLASANAVPGVRSMTLGLKKLHDPEKTAMVPLLSCDTAAFRMLGFEVKERFLDADARSFWITETTAAGVTGLPYGENNFDSIVMWQKRCMGMPVCGVLADFSMQDALHVTDEDYVIVFGNGGWKPDSHLLIDVVGDHREAKRAIDAVYKKHCEKVFGAYLEPDYNDFVENVIAKQYDKQRRQMRLIELIMAISVVLSLLGLVAMSTHFASEREKTIAIRKVFGGTMQSEIRRNLKEYIIMILIANVIAIPVAVWFCKRYLEDFAYRIDLHPWIFVVTVALSFVIAIGSVLWQIVSVARVNPVRALKKE